MIGSERLTTKPLYEPYHKIFFTDNLIQNDYANKLKQYKGSRIFDYDFLKNRDPYLTLFRLGRPLWASLLNVNYGNAEVLALAKKKLIFQEHGIWDPNDDKQALSVLMSRTTLQISQRLSYGSELIAKHMCTLYYMDKNLQDLEFRYFSEPILAEAAAQITGPAEVQADVLEKLNDILAQMSLNQMGSVGEIASELILLSACDAVNKEKSEKSLYSSSVTVNDFLEKLVGQDSYKKMTSKIKLEMLEGLVSFTHFIRRIDVLTLPNVIEHFIGRAAACQFKNNTPKLDLCIPVVLKSGEINYIFI
jgi:hypothetical protein